MDSTYVEKQEKAFWRIIKKSQEESETPKECRLTGVIEKLLVYPERMQKNLDRMGGLVHSQRVLLALTQAGISREDSYSIVQRNAMKVWEIGRAHV